MPTPQQALSAAFERWNAGDLDGYLSLYDEGIRLHGYSPEPMDKIQVQVSTGQAEQAVGHFAHDSLARSGFGAWPGVTTAAIQPPPAGTGIRLQGGIWSC